MRYGTTSHEEAQGLLEDITHQLPPTQDQELVATEKEKNMHCMECNYIWNAHEEWKPELTCPQCDSGDIASTTPSQLSDQLLDEVEPLIVGWVKYCEGKLLQIDGTVCSTSDIEVLLKDTIPTKDGSEIVACSLEIPGVPNPWSATDDCFGYEYDQKKDRTTYHFYGKTAELLRKLFSV